MINATDRTHVVVLDIVTEKVADLVVELMPDGMDNIIGVCRSPARGKHKIGGRALQYVGKILPSPISNAEKK
ncbi:cell division protein FtsA, partial [Escherichia coli]|nr:cell division protein FtsA [Escherichia coli]